MTCVYHTSDWHLGHKNAYKWSGKFSSQEEREGNIIENYCSQINKRDHVYFHGDIAFTIENLAIIKKLVGIKHLILGNHDTDDFSKGIDIANLILVFDTVHGIKERKQSWLSHSPIHEQELRGKINIHGHVHHNTIDDPRYYNVCLENTDFKPKKYQDIIDECKSRDRRPLV